MSALETAQEFHTMKALLETHNEYDPEFKKHAIVEYRDGTHAVANMQIVPQARSDRKCEVPPDVSGCIRRITEVERITFFVGGEEYEFVACQG